MDICLQAKYQTLQPKFLRCKWRHLVPAARTSEKTRISDIPSVTWHWPSGQMLTFTASEFACKKLWTSSANRYAHRGKVYIGLHSTKDGGFSQLFFPYQTDRMILSSIFIVFMCAAFCVLVPLFACVYAFSFLSCLYSVTVCIYRELLIGANMQRPQFFLQYCTSISQK
jgi:hypothetical protein